VISNAAFLDGCDLEVIFWFTISVEKWKEMLVNYQREFYFGFPTRKEKLETDVTCNFFKMEFTSFSSYKK